MPNAPVDAAIADGNGGWFITGSFFNYQLPNFARTLHLNGDGSVDSSFYVGFRGYSLALSGDTLFVGGAGSDILQSFNSGTGNALSFPNISSGVIYDILVRGNMVYFSGTFTSVGGLSYVARINRWTGAVSGWNPQPNGPVYDLAAKGDTIFASGDFTSIGGITCQGVAALDDVFGTAYPWTPAFDGPIECLAVHEDRLFVGGDFTTAEGQARAGLAAFDLASFSLEAWDTQLTISGVVRSLAIGNGKLHIGGSFSNVGSALVHDAAMVDLLTAAPTDWTPPTFNPGLVDVIVPSGSRVLVGGSFDRIADVDVDGVSALDIVSGEPLDFPVGYINDQVQVIERYDNTLYMGGPFTSINGQPRNHLAAIDLTTAALLPWDPSPDGEVTHLAVFGNRIYVAGEFTTIAGQARSRLASFDLASGSLNGWNPFPDGEIFGLDATGGLIYVGGDFNSVGGELRDQAAALDPVTGLATPWEIPPFSTAEVVAFEQVGGVVYVGGHFINIGGESRHHLAALDAVTGLATPWDPGADWDVTTLASNGSQLFVGGVDNIGGSGSAFVGFDLSTGLLNWDPSMGQDVYCALVSDDGWIYVGGNYVECCSEQPQPNLAAFDGNAIITAVEPFEIGSMRNGRLWPNPASRQVTLTDLPISGQVIVRNAMGETLLSQVLPGEGTVTLALPSIAQSLVFVSVLSAEGLVISTGKLAIMH
ncbi:MAG: hypothetical protein WAU70_16645 [Flavobacteriales bacterium]